MPRPRFRPRLEHLDDRRTPAFLTGAEIVVGADAGSPPLVRLIDPNTQAERTQFLAFDGGFFGGVRVAVADVTGDRHPDLVAAAGPSGGPIIQVYDGQSGGIVSTFWAFGPSFTGGVNIAAADLDGDGKAEVIAGAGGGGGPQVTVFDGLSGQPKASWFAYDEGFRNGVRVAAGDTDGDGRAEVVTGAGYGGGPDVRTFKVNPGTGAVQNVGAFWAFSSSFTGGVYVASGDTDGDGKAEIIAGAGPGGGPQVSVFKAGGVQVSAFFAYDSTFRGGVRVGAADLTGDGTAEVLAVAGPTGAAQVNVYSLPSATPIASTFGFPTNQLTGAFVAGSPTPLNVPPTPAFVVADSYQRLAELKQMNQPVIIVKPPPTVIINQTVYAGWPLWGPWFGGGFFAPWWFGPTFFDAPGLYLGLGTMFAPTFFGSVGFFGAPTFVPAPDWYGPAGDPVIDPTVFDPYGYPLSDGYLDYLSTVMPADPVYVDPGYNDPYYYDPGYGDPGYYDPGYFDPGYFDPGYYDYGYYDYGWGGDWGGDWGGGWF